MSKLPCDAHAHLTFPPLAPPFINCPFHTPALLPGSGDGQTASLRDVCFKPFGTECATQSVLQYWKMDPEFFEAEQKKVRQAKCRCLQLFQVG